MSEPIPYTERFVVQEDTSRLIARIWLADRLRTRRVWVFLLAVYVVLVAIYLTGMDPYFDVWFRLLWAAILALVPLAVFVALLSFLIYRRTARDARTRLPVGSILESGFGPDALVVKNPLSESRIKYEGITSIRRRGGFVLLRQTGMPVTSVFPAVLFPDDACERIKASTR